MGKKIGITILLVAIVTIGISAVALRNGRYRQLKGTPEEIVMAAIENTNRKISKEQEALNEKLGTDKVEAILKSRTKEVYANLCLGNEANEEVILTNKVQISPNQLYGNLKLADPDKDILEAKLYRKGNKASFYIPQLFESPYAVKLSTLEEDYKASALATLLGEEDINQLSQSALSVSRYLKGILTLQDNEQFMKQTFKLKEDILKNLNLKETGIRPVVLDDNTNTEWISYSGMLNKEQTTALISQELDLFMQLDFVKDYFEVLAQQSDMTFDELMAQVNDNLLASDDIKVNVTFLVDDMYLRSLVINFYEDSKSLMDVAIRYLGHDNLIDKMVIRLESEVEQIDVSVDVTQDTKSDIYLENIALSLNENVDEVEEQYIAGMNYNYTYDTQKTDNNMMINFDLIVNDDVIFNYDAKGTKTVKPDSITTSVTQGEMTIKEGQAEEKVYMTANYGIEKIEEKEIVIEEDEPIYILEMDKAEIEHAFEIIQNNLMKLIFGL